MSGPHDVLGFWFSNTARPNWFVKTAAFDDEVRTHLLEPYRAAAEGRLEDWRDDPRGCLALVILLDQVPRNIHRDTAQAFATDAAALKVARQAVERGYDQGCSADERMFLYLPFEHSEDLADQRRCVELVATRIGPGVYLDFAEQHLRIIERFGRFPHRNRLLGRRSTPDEEDFLKQPGSSF
jgi:uncharacterized protein (DUF924 family)